MRKFLSILFVITMTCSMVACANENNAPTLQENEHIVQHTEMEIDPTVESTINPSQPTEPMGSINYFLNDMKQRKFVLYCSQFYDRYDELTELADKAQSEGDINAFNNILLELESTKVILDEPFGLEFIYEYEASADGGKIDIWLESEIIGHITFTHYESQFDQYFEYDEKTFVDENVIFGDTTIAGRYISESVEHSDLTGFVFSAWDTDDVLAVFRSNDNVAFGTIECNSMDLMNVILPSIHILHEEQANMSTIDSYEIDRIKELGKHVADLTLQYPAIMILNQFDEYDINVVDDGFTLANKGSNNVVKLISTSFAETTRILNEQLSANQVENMYLFSVGDVEGTIFDATALGAGFWFYGWTINSNMPIIVEEAESIEEIAMILNNVVIERRIATAEDLGIELIQ